MTELRFDGHLDLHRTLGVLGVGAGDPTQRITPHELIRATRTPDGPATLHASLTSEHVLRLRSWGPGSDWLLASAPDLLGLRDVPYEPADAPRALRDLAHRARGTRLSRTHRVVEMLVPIVLQQKVSGKEAARAFRNLIRTFSEPAPGPFDGLLLPLSPEQLRELPAASFIPLGVPPRQGEVLRELGWRARRLEEVSAMDADQAERRLTALRGLGPWSARSAMLRGLGHPDAVVVGDYNLPHLIAFHLAGEERADDARMLELLEPYRGQRGRVIRWIAAAGRHPPRRGARRALRPLPPERRLLWRSLRRS